LLEALITTYYEITQFCHSSVTQLLLDCTVYEQKNFQVFFSQPSTLESSGKESVKNAWTATGARRRRLEYAQPNP